MIPFHGGAFLPAEQRYTSSIYRRLHRIDRAEWLSLGEAAELVAVVRLAGFKAATAMFQWNRHRARQAARLVSHEPVIAKSEAYHDANLRVLSAEDGLAALRAMLDGGWRGQPPDFVMRAIAAERKSGKSVQNVADSIGVGFHRLVGWIHPRVGSEAKRAAAAALLTIG